MLKREELNKIDLKAVNDTQLQRYDIYLCHSSRDTSEVIQVKNYIESKESKTVCALDMNSRLTANGGLDSQTIEFIKEKLNSSNELYLLLSNNTTDSVWLSWQIGYFESLKPKNIKTFSVIEESKQEVLSFKGKEFFGLYPEYNMTEDDIFNLQKDACISNLIL